MAIDEYAVGNDFFQCNDGLDFPCSSCKHASKKETNERPCRFCGHNDDSVSVFNCYFCDEIIEGNPFSNEHIFCKNTTFQISGVCKNCLLSIKGIN
jgi:hypothetical protein